MLARNKIGAIIRLYLATEMKSGLIFFTCQETVAAIIKDPNTKSPAINGMVTSGCKKNFRKNGLRRALATREAISTRLEGVKKQLTFEAFQHPL